MTNGRRESASPKIEKFTKIYEVQLITKAFDGKDQI